MACRNLLRALVCSLSIGAAGQACADGVTDQARALLERGDPRSAYALLSPLEADRAGDPDYDFLLGLAALDSGRNTNAVFALERVLAVNPGHARARAEIARAYAALGENQAARQEFETVKKQGVPAEVAATIDKFLSAIERIEDQGRTVLRGYAEFALGHDTNINAGPSMREIAIPFFGGAVFELGQTSIRQGSNFWNLGGGLSVRHPLRADLALNAGLSGTQRLNNRYDQFDTGSLDGNVGLTLTRGKDAYSASFQASTLWVGDGRNRDVWGFTGQWQHNYDARNQATGYVQYSRVEYPFQSVRDVNRWVAGGAYGHALAASKTVLYGGAYVGTEQDREHAPYVANNLWGLRGGLQHELRNDVSLLASVSYESRAYQGDDPLFLTRRDDDQFALGVAAQFRPQRDFTVTPQYSYMRNKSNIGISDYTRHIASVTVRYDF